MARGKMYPRCSQCDKLFSENGYYDDSIALSQIEAFPYCSDCIKKNGWKKCPSCDKWGDFNNKCLGCQYKDTKRESQKLYEQEKKRLEVEYKKNLQKNINEILACQGTCGRAILLEESSYTWKGEGNYCKDCIENKIVQEYNKKHQGDPNNQLVCNLCKTKPADYRWPDTGKGVCEDCKPRFVIGISAMEKLMKGEIVNIDSLNLPESDKVSLRAGQKILKGESVNIDNLVIDEEDKEDLRELQKQKPPHNNNYSNYSVNCQSCAKKYQVTIVPPHCQHCQSRSIKVYDEAGFLQILPLDNNQQNNQGKKKNEDDISPYVIIPIGLVLAASSFLLYRWWKKRKKIKHY